MFYCALVTPQNAAIARESLELLMTCLKLRSPLLNIFYTLPQVDDFICDILQGCAHPDVRFSMANQLNQLCSDIDAGERREGESIVEAGREGVEEVRAIMCSIL